MIKINNKGFSLIELMVVVGIIGILAAVAVPNLLKFQAKAKQSNAKTELSAIYGVQKAFAVEWSIYTTNLKLLGFAPDGVPTASGCVSNGAPTERDTASGTSSDWPLRYYAVGFKDTSTPPKQLQTQNDACKATHVQNTIGTTLKLASDLTRSSIDNTKLEFKAHALGLISSEKKADKTNLEDEWTINQAKILTNDVIGY